MESLYLSILLLVTAVYKLIVYPAFLSPLARIPHAHWSSGFCPLWIYWMRWTSRENRTVYERHMRLGPAVRLAPGLVSINCFDEGLKKIYQGGFPKPVFYFRGFAIYNTENIFTFEDNAPHTARKRQISNTFSKSFVLASPTARASTRDVLFNTYLPLLSEAARSQTPVEVLQMNYSYAMDTFVGWQFGRSLSSNMLGDARERQMYLDGFFAPYPYLFWMYYFPGLAALLRKVGVYLVPQSVDAKFGAIEDWNLEKCDRAQQLLASGKPLAPENQPVVFEQALRAMSDLTAPARAYPQRLQIASDMFAHNSAAFETSGNTETYLMWEMSRNPEWQARLYEELRGVSPSLVQKNKAVVQMEDMPEPRDLDSLPILHAVIMETLRLWPAVPGGQPRVVPRACSLGGYDDIPAGTVVQSYAYILHRTPEVFPEPHAWRPERWLDADPEHLAVMKRWFWGFSSGGRMCIGSNFAFYSMKYLVAAIYANFTTTIHDHGDMDLLDAYLAGPKGHRLEIKFTERSSQGESI
ncbi:hypothetical protein ASPZODRAFT_1313769 [Penicilliopsis zonata CBS 506.65]|uniref:Cytochrome P450 monooxygenase n=1 Tax=Penicilliopsis zonata CBS 506.65 TaxID=1073090 RepID=A0A1L9S5G2_9EURO|nr:hypothetical protein ASPZODRAFT_1313769 [Penicilliopsis zonata CBS 506.65]OJJ42395.1 hypothetical protein ASPZODRAFT_1313769 [Penicilliopsis zonata CBS 506.65]